MGRAFSGLIYLGATVLWSLFMAMTQAMRCDDACSAPQFAQDWHDNVDAWQYGVVGWLGAAGLGVAILAICLSFVRRWLAVVALVIHGAVFTANAVILYGGRTIYGSWIPFALIVGTAAIAGLVAVGALRRPTRTA